MSGELSPALQGALSQDRIWLFGYVKIVLPSHTIRLIDGSATVTLGGEVYTGRDETYGVLDYIRGLDDKLDSKAPEITLGLIPAGDTAIAGLIDPALQGSPVTIGIGALDPNTGLALDTGYAMFAGELDYATLKWTDNDKRIEFKVTTAAERLFTTEEGIRLSDAFHQTVWPDETGLFAVTDVEVPVAWGSQFDSTQFTIRTDRSAGSWIGGGAAAGGAGGFRFGEFVYTGAR